jgi:hypothetical protein
LVRICGSSVHTASTSSFCTVPIAWLTGVLLGSLAGTGAPPSVP